MLDFILKLEVSVWAQVPLLIILVTAYHLLQRKLPGYRAFGVALWRIVVVLLVFVLAFMTWSGEVNPTLRTMYILVMSLTNLYMLWQVILTLKEMGRRPRSQGEK